MTEAFIQFCRHVIEALGYPGVFVLMFGESMWFPIPSFAVMPFVGFSASQGGPNALAYWPGIVVGAAGGLAGSLTTYAIGYFGGPAGVRRLGGYVGLDVEHLTYTEAWLRRHGVWAVFVARFIPVVRHFSSTVCGVGKMPLVPFIIMTVAGAGTWAWILTFAGFKLGEHYPVIARYTKPIDVAVIALLGLGAVAWTIRLVRRRRAAAAKPVLASDRATSSIDASTEPP
jgi:membrane protein DedA with SNARE-associated domain